MFWRPRRDSDHESRFGRSFWATLILFAAALAYVAWSLVKIKRGDAGAAIGFVGSVFLCAPLLALFLVNLPKFAKEAAAARAKPLSGVVHRGFEIKVMTRAGSVYANATQAARALGKDPKRWPMGFARMGPGAVIRLDGELWARRDAWAWRVPREGDPGLDRLGERLDKEAFGAWDRREEAAERMRVEQASLAQRGPERAGRLPGEIGQAEAEEQAARRAEPGAGGPSLEPGSESKPPRAAPPDIEFW